MELFPDDHSPVEVVPVEQTRVYQNQPSPENPIPPFQLSTLSTPESPSDSGVRQKTQIPTVKRKPSHNTPKLEDTDQNWIAEDQSVPTDGRVTNVGFDSNGAVWVTEVTEQPGFLFPVARPTSPPTMRRQITEEASLSVTPNQVAHR